VSASTVTYPDRDVRQREIVPPQKLAACRAVVVGVGAIGRQVALQLAAVGLPAMDLVDHDEVGVENLATQAYRPADVGRPKVLATADDCRSIHPPISLTVHPERFRRSMARELAAFTNPAVKPAVFCCVDSMAARRLVWESVRPRAAFWADGRMAAEVVRVLASPEPAGDPSYPATLFGDDRAYVGGSCTAKSTVYSGSIAAGLMLTQFTRWLRGLPVDRDLLLNLLSSEMVVS
jgi:sulfur carrier protein ThiS adenylyltransferase